MTVLSIEEFNQQSSSGINSLEKIYQGKSIEGGPVFSLTNLQAATLYCERFSKKQNGAMCIIVKEKGFFRIWSETHQDNYQALEEPNKSSADLPLPEKTQSPLHRRETEQRPRADVRRKGTRCDSVPAVTGVPRSTSANSLPVEAEFIAVCQKLLAEYIGPIAPIICKKTLAKKPNLTRAQFVEILAKKLSDPNQALEFKQVILE